MPVLSFCAQQNYELLMNVMVHHIFVTFQH